MVKYAWVSLGATRDPKHRCHLQGPAALPVQCSYKISAPKSPLEPLPSLTVNFVFEDKDVWVVFFFTTILPGLGKPMYIIEDK